MAPESGGDMNFVKWIWAFVPAPAKVWVAIVGVALVIGALAGIVWKIDQGGYKRCEGKYAGAALDLKDESRKDILKVEEKYDGVKNEIIRQQGPNDPVGPRVEFAIDRMPSPPGR